MLTSLMILSLATFAFAGAGFIEDDSIFYIVSLVARTVQGLGEAMFMVTAPSILAVEYPDKLEDYYVYWNVALGLGNSLGPAITAILCIWLTYTETLAVFAALLCMVGCSMLFMLPKKI